MRNKIFICICSLLFLFLPFSAFSQDFRLVEFKKTGERTAIIDGEKYYIFPEKKGRKMIKDLSSLKQHKKKNKRLEQKNQLLEEKSKNQEKTIKFLNSQLDMQIKFSEKVLGSSEKPKKKIWETTGFHFALGFFVASGSYYAWQQSVKVNLLDTNN